MQTIAKKRDDRLNRDIGIAVQMIVSFFRDRSIDDEIIVLCGSYGRGEGAWVEDDDGNVSPYNDYDFTVITDARIERCDLDKLRTQIADTIGIEWVDIDLYRRNHFRILLPTIKNYDFLYAGRCLYGHEFWRGKKISSKRIGSADICKLLMTRIWTFLGSFQGAFHDLDTEESMFFEYQMAKAVYAAIDMKLVRNGLYKSSYSEKITQYLKMQPDIKDRELAEWAWNTKIHPIAKITSKVNAEKMYREVYDFFFRALRTTITGFDIIKGNEGLLLLYVYSHSRYLYHIACDKIFRRGEHFHNSVRVFLVQWYIFAAYSEKEPECHLRRAGKLLRGLGYDVASALDWAELKDLAASARNDV